MGSNPVEGAIITKIKMKMELDERIVALRKEGHSYKSIRLKLGNPSNKRISEVLTKHCPELAGDSEGWKALQKRIYEQ